MEDERKPPAKDNNNDNPERKRRRARKVPKRQRNPNLRGGRRPDSEKAPSNEMPTFQSSLGVDSISEDEALPDVAIRERETGRWDSSGTNSGTDSDTAPSLGNMARATRAASKGMAVDKQPKVPRRKMVRRAFDSSATAKSTIQPEITMAALSDEEKAITEKSARAQANSGQELKKPARRGSGNAAETALPAQAQAVEAVPAVAAASPAMMQSFATPQNQSQRPPTRRNSIAGSSAQGAEKTKKDAKTKTKPKRKSIG